MVVPRKDGYLYSITVTEGTDKSKELLVHDLRGWITVLIGYSEMLLDSQPRLTEQQRGYVEKMAETVDLMRRRLERAVE